MTYVASLLALALAPPLADAAPSDPYAGLNDRLRQVLERFDAAQVDVRSLSARFVEFKEIGLLKNAVTQEGQFYHSKPDKFLWEYTAPDPKLLLMNGTSLVAYYPNHKQAEVIQTRLSRKLVKYFGLGQVFADLRNYYDLSLLDDDTVNGARAISMTPRRKRLAKRLLEVRVWLDEELNQIRRLEYLEVDGDRTSITFEDIQVNPTIAATRYEIDLPEDVIVSNSFSGFFTEKGR